MSRGYLIVNPRSGDDSPSAEELVESGGRQGVRVSRPPGTETTCEALARGAAADALGMAGGDGRWRRSRRLRSNATSRSSHPVLDREPLRPRPRARPRRPAGLRSPPLSGVEQRIDVARVNDRLFSTTCRSASMRTSSTAASTIVVVATFLAACARWGRDFSREHHRLRVRLDGGPSCRPACCWSPTTATTSACSTSASGRR